MPQYGDLVILASPRGKRHIYRIEEGHDLHTQDGVMRAADLAASEFGTEVRTAMGVPFRLEKPQLYDLVMGIKRQTQIMYPKDMGLICFKLGVGNGRTILEAGSGSGGFTLALSWFSGPNGHVHSFEAREEFHKLAKRNLAWAGVGDNVTFHLRDIADGFCIDNADALFLDVRTPWEYLDHAVKAVKPGATFGFLVPTVDQVSKLLMGLEKGPFADIEVCEILMRNWKPVADRLRPEDRMNAHTGFLIFCRHQERSADFEYSRPLGTRQRKQEAARQARLAESGANPYDDETAGDDE